MFINNIKAINLSKSINIIILFIFTITPIFTFQESLALVMGDVKSQTVSLTPVYIKILKDISFILLVVFTFLKITYSKKILKFNIFILIYLFFCIFIAYVTKDNLLIFLSGMRWLLPIVLIFVLVPFVKKDLIVKMTYIGFYLFVFHFIMQIIQLFFSQGWYGFNSLGLSLRNPGLFFIPSTAAFFTILILFLNMFFMQNAKYKKMIFILAPLSILLTTSGSGIVVYFVIIFVYLLKKKYFIFLPLFILILFFLMLGSLDSIVGRDGFIAESFGTRLTIFFQVLENSHLLSAYFGYATNTSLLMGGYINSNLDGYVADSTYASILGNLGVATLIIVLLFIFFFTLVTYLKKDKEVLIFICIFLLFGATTIIMEVYPMNLLFAVLTAYYLKNYKMEKLYETSNNSQ